MSSLFLYFLLKLTAIGLSMLWIGALLIIFCAICLFITAIYSDEQRVEWWPVYKKFRPFLLTSIGGVLIILGVMIPTTKQMAVIYVIPKVANSQIIQKIPSKILALSEEWLEELRPKKNLEGKNLSDSKQKQPLVSDNEE